MIVDPFILKRFKQFLIFFLNVQATTSIILGNFYTINRILVIFLHRLFAFFLIGDSHFATIFVRIRIHVILAFVIRRVLRLSRRSSGKSSSGRCCYRFLLLLFFNHFIFRFLYFLTSALRLYTLRFRFRILPLISVHLLIKGR